MKNRGLDFDDILQDVCLSQQSAQGLPEYPRGWLRDPPRARLRDDLPKTVVGSLSHEDLIHADNYRRARATTFLTISLVSSVV